VGNGAPPVKQRARTFYDAIDPLSPLTFFTPSTTFCSWTLITWSASGQYWVFGAKWGEAKVVSLARLSAGRWDWRWGQIPTDQSPYVKGHSPEFCAHAHLPTKRIQVDVQSPRCAADPTRLAVNWL